MRSPSLWLLAGLGWMAVLPRPLLGQQDTTTLIYQGATVRVRVPTIGPGWLPGKFAHARSRSGDCLGVAVHWAKAGPTPVLVMLGGVTALQVDRRTNTDLQVFDLDAPPASAGKSAHPAEAPDSDWQPIDLAALKKTDHQCKAAQ